MKFVIIRYEVTDVIVTEARKKTEPERSEAVNN
jgi:hypothetical protein